MAKKRPARIAARSTPLTFISRSRQVSSEEKALYHNVLGAGRSGIIREFFGLTPDNQTELRQQLEQLVQKRLPT